MACGPQHLGTRRIVERWSTAPAYSWSRPKRDFLFLGRDLGFWHTAGPGRSSVYDTQPVEPSSPSETELDVWLTAGVEYGHERGVSQLR